MICHNRLQKSCLLSLMILTTLISGCALATESSTQPVTTSSAPSQSVTPSTIPSPTLSPTSTLTPTPTITSTPSSTPTPHSLSITTSNIGSVKLLAKLGTGKADDVAWSSDGKLLAVASEMIEIYDAESLAQIQKIDGGAYQLLFSPDDLFLTIAGNSIQFLDTSNWKPVRTIHYEFGLREIIYSPDGKYIAATGMGGGDEHIVQIWSVETGQEVFFTQDSYGLAGISFSPDGQFLGVSSPNGTMLIEVASGNKRNFEQGEPFNIAFLSSTTFINNEFGKISIFNVDGELIKKLNIPSSHDGFVLSPDNTKLATIVWTDRWELQVWDLLKETRINSFPLHTYFNMVAFSPNSKKLAVVDYAGPVRIWDLRSGRKIGQIEYTSRANTVAFRPLNSNNNQSPYLLAAGYDGGQTLVWNLHTESIHQSLDGVSGSRVHTTAFTADGELLVSGFQGDHPFWIWDIKNGQKLGELECGESMRHLNRLEVQLPEVACKEPLYIGNMPLPPEYENAGPGDFHFSPDNRFIVAWSYDLAIIFVWDAVTHEFLHALKGHKVYYFDGDVGGIEELIIHPYYNIIATAGYDGTVRLWDIEQGSLLQTLTDPRGTVNSVAFSPDGRFLAAGVYDGSVYIWGIDSP